MKKINITKYIRKDIAGMDKYIPVASLWDISQQYNQKPEDVCKLDAGENQFGYAPEIRKTLQNSAYYNFYPDPEYKELRKAIAKYTQTDSKNIFVGSGSDEVLDLLFRLLLEEGDKVITCPPTFGMYSVLIKLNKGIVVSIPRNSDYSLNIPAIKNAVDAKVKAIIICTPNNPTGTVSCKNEIIDLLKTNVLVMVDEAYFEFYGISIIPLIKTYKNLIVLRTFSKWAGLAGLRLGYGVMDPYFVDQLFKIKPPYNVNLAACFAGITALQNVGYSKTIIRVIKNERDKMIKELNNIPYLRTYPSNSNALFIKVTTNLVRIKKYLEKKKIFVRYYDSAATGPAIRISIGRPEQNIKITDALQIYEKT